MSKYKALSLFSGAGGLDIGIEQSGIEICCGVEYNKTFAETLRKNSGIPIIESDIKDVTLDTLLEISSIKEKEEIDIIIGGPPCQPFSSAGNRRGLEDFRGNAIYEFIRMVKEINPKVFLLENVRGLLYSKLKSVPEDVKSDYEKMIGKKGSVLYLITNELSKLGYKISFSLFDTANYGVPQKRERLLIFGSRTGQEVPLPRPTHNEKGTNGLLPWKTLQDAIGDLSSNDDGHHYVNLREKSVKFLKKLNEGENWRNLSEEDQKEALGKSYYLGGGKTGFLRRLSWSKPSPTLVTNPTMPATLLCHPEKLRPLSIEEYSRIQEFPDDWEFVGSTNKIYVQIGNAVPVGLGKVAGKTLLKVLDGKIDKNDYPNNLKFSRYNNTDHVSFKKYIEEQIGSERRRLF
jgi:DNA (cytosine-5)-methyltransferase 1